MHRKSLILRCFLLLCGKTFALKLGEERQDINVGYCINGLARTFGTPMVYKSIFKNLVTPFGGKPHIFASITVEEKQSAAKTFATAQGEPDEQSLQKGLDHLKAVIGGDEATSAKATAQDEQSASHFLTSQQQLALKKAFKTLAANGTPVVVDLQTSDVKQSVINETIAATDCKGVTKDWLYPALIAQLVHSEQCWNMFTAYEKQHGITFDKLVYLRPDATWVKPVQAHSDATQWPAASVVTNAGGADWAAFGTRSKMSHWFNRLRWHKEVCKATNAYPLDVAVPVASGLGRYFAAVGVDLQAKQIPVVVVRDVASRSTAGDACRYAAYVWAGTGWDCMSSIYEPNGPPRDDESGPWW